MSEALLIGGTYDNLGEESRFARKLYFTLATQGVVDNLPDFHFLNGGRFQELEEVVRDAVPHMDYVFWFANVPDNDKPKLVNRIKAINKKCILVTSKRNDGGKYEIQDLIQHALKNKSNLLVEFQKREADGRIFSRILDPLGNLVEGWTDDVVVLARALAERVKYLKGITRVGSVKVGDALEVPDETEFFRFVRESGEQFSKLLPTPSETHRFLGNASFRCRHGFPSFRKDGMIYVSKRNVDKTLIGSEGFVAVNPDKLPVEYYGDHKPSVDAPVHVQLYKRFSKINYMLHGHVYIRDARKTKVNVPCGGMEEVHEIIDAVNYHSGIYRTDTEVIMVNLRGHGFLLGFSDVAYIKQMTSNVELLYEARVFPEEI